MLVAGGFSIAEKASASSQLFGTINPTTGVLTLDSQYYTYADGYKYYNAVYPNTAPHFMGSALGGQYPWTTFNFTAGYGDGDYYFMLINCTSSCPNPGDSGDLGYVSAHYSSVNGWTTSSPPGLTRIVDFTPHDNTVSSSTVNFSLHVYVDPDDIGSFLGVKVSLYNYDQNVLLPNILSPFTITFLENYKIATSGDYYFATTTFLGDGNYRVEALLDRSVAWGLFNNPFSDISDDQSHQFIVNQGSFIGNISQSSFGAIAGYYASSTATSTMSLAHSCGLFSDTASVMNCLAFLFVPDSYQLQKTMENFKVNVGTHFPLGYLTDFIVDISSTSTRSIPIINAVIPSVLPGAGSAVVLDVAHSLDFILYATSSQFNNISASSSATFYDITSYYWNIFIYLALVFYLMTRLLGSNVIGGITIGGSSSPRHFDINDEKKRNQRNNINI